MSSKVWTLSSEYWSSKSCTKRSKRQKFVVVGFKAGCRAQKLHHNRLVCVISLVSYFMFCWLVDYFHLVKFMRKSRVFLVEALLSGYFFFEKLLWIMTPLQLLPALPHFCNPYHNENFLLLWLAVVYWVSKKKSKNVLKLRWCIFWTASTKETQESHTGTVKLSTSYFSSSELCGLGYFHRFARFILTLIENMLDRCKWINSRFLRPEWPAKRPI